MADFVMIALLLYLIFKDWKLEIKPAPEKKVDLAKEQEIKDREAEFQNIMNYSIDKAIESKRGER